MFYFVFLICQIDENIFEKNKTKKNPPHQHYNRLSTDQTINASHKDWCHIFFSVGRGKCR